MRSSERTLEEEPVEHLSGIENCDGDHDGSAPLPENCRCRYWRSCGEWNVTASAQQQGLHLARFHALGVSA